MDGFVDLALTPEEMEARSSLEMPLADIPKYPYGTSISLDENVLEKMEIDHEDWSMGDIFHLHALAKVTAISEHENQEGNKCCITLQIIALKGESEDEEDKKSFPEDAEPSLEKYGYSRYR
jgi:hypothetical protein